METRRPTGQERGRRRGAACLSCCLLVSLSLALSACHAEETVVQYKPFFTGIAGAEFKGAQPVNTRSGYVDPTQAPDQKLVVEKSDGSKVLIAKSVRHMMTHLERCLDEGDDDLLMEQVISEKTKQEYRGRGKDPKEVIKMLRKNRKEIAKLFARMPLGEYTPTVILEQPGDKTWVVRLSGAPAEGMKYTKLWARLEEGNWRFVWVD